MNKKVNLTDLRFSKADWYGNSEEIIVGGAGTIGSFLTPILCRLGHEVYLYDMDNVEEHNIGVQLFGFESIGKSKVDAVKNLSQSICLFPTIETYNKEYTVESLSSNIMISCFDNMLARRTMFNNWVSFVEKLIDSGDSVNNCIFIDGRMDFTQFQIYCVTPDNIQRYKGTLFSDKDIDDAPCTLKTTPFIGPTIAGLMSSLLCSFLGNVYTNENMYDIPFKVSLMFNPLILNYE